MGGLVVCVQGVLLYRNWLVAGDGFTTTAAGQGGAGCGVNILSNGKSQDEFSRPSGSGKG